MKICDINDSKIKDYIVLLPKCDYDIKDSVEYSFKNVFYLDYDLNENDAEILIDYINNKLKQLILFDYDDFYRLILPYIKKSKKISWIYKNNCASLTDGCVRATFSNIMEFYDRNIINKIGCLDYATYEVLRNAKYNVSYVMLDIDPKSVKKAKVKSKTIGLIGSDFNPNHNIYNQLSALKMVDYDYVKIISSMKATKEFIPFFEIKAEEMGTINEVMSDNFVNLYCNFTFTNNELILKSLDSGVPCLLGNTDIFDKYIELKKSLVLNSDDDINEIAHKLNLIKKNKKNILDQYLKFRKDYSTNSLKTIKNFLK